MFLKDSWIIKKAQKYNLIFEIAILSLENSFLFICFINLYLIIGINKI